MGTDIHLYVERRVGGAWVSCDSWTADGEVDYDQRFYRERNYDLFAILADVRNGSGFAGVRTGDGFVPIAAPRGWPKDCSPELQKIEVDHTPGWLTVAELMAYDWTQEARKQGWVRLKEWARWRISGAPQEWAGGIDGKSIRKLPEGVVDAAWEEHRTGQPYEVLWEEDGGSFELRLGGPEVYTQVRWEVRYYEVAAKFLSHTLPRLWRLGRPEDVRIVFYFDS